ncbi:hypothetical protein [Xanthomonas campestris]|uniref:hypothetical protein n=1 Tax=Xanthomonas campestris TaxID=339 RepID=UPI0005AF2217|nr:hypothetical protein [Xanthomonas campestris]KIQ25547.1 hypothetical protein RT95_14220 [Xanthomonas campestris]
MWFTKNFRSIWWLILVICLSYVIGQRLTTIESGDARPIDFLLIVIWLGVCLGPLFAEIHLPWIKLKQKMDELKQSVSSEVASTRNEIRNNVEVRSNVSPNFWLGNPPPDYKLGDIEQQLATLVRSLEHQGYAVHPPVKLPELGLGLSIADQVMFRSRRDLEIELRALANDMDEAQSHSRLSPISRLVMMLTQNGIIDKQMANIIREVYSV